MTKTEEEEYLLKNEYELFIKSEKLIIEQNKQWTQLLPCEPAVFILREDSDICYVGETSNLRNRLNTIFNLDSVKVYSKNIIAGKIKQLLEGNPNKKYTISFVKIKIGREELKNKIIRSIKPKLNNNTKRHFSIKDKQAKDKHAYDPWTKELDSKLELLFCNGETVKELSKIFERKQSAIESRIKKLELEEKY